MTNLPNRDDREAERRFIIVVRTPRPPPLQLPRRQRAAPRGKSASAQKVVSMAAAAEISIIKIGLVYVIMIVIAAVVMAGATQHSHTHGKYIHTTRVHLQTEIQFFFIIYTNTS